MKVLIKEYNAIDLLIQFVLNLSIEVFCFCNGQTISRTILNIIIAFFIIWILGSNERKKKTTILYFLFTLFSCIEAYNYSFVAEPFNLLSISAIDTSIIKLHPIFAVEGVLLLVFLIIYVFLMPKLVQQYISESTEKKFSFETYNWTYLIAIFIFGNLFFLYFKNICHDFKGKHNHVVFDQMGNDLYLKLKYIISANPKIISFKDPIDLKNPDYIINKKHGNQENAKKKRKNLFIMQLESVENQMIDPTSMPYLYNLSQNYQYFAPIKSTPYSTWSSTGSILIQCGVPQIVTSVSAILRLHDSIDDLKKMPCISDYLKPYGYEFYFGIIGPEEIQGLKSWRQAKNYQLVFQSDSDPELFDYINDQFLPKVKDYGRNETDERRFIGWFFNHDTHKPYEPKSWCNPRNKKEPSWKQCGDCVDQQIKRFIEKFFEMKMDETTVLAVLPDHITFGNSLPQPHELFLLFPGMKKTSYKNRSPLTYYDVSHTLLDVIGVDQIEPKFIFGNSMFSPDEGENSSPTKPKN